jgi:hypothetical protein
MLIIELCCLRGRGGGYVIKELAATGVEKGGAKTLQTFMFQPPYAENQLGTEERRTNRWVTGNLHSISWSDGYIPYDKLTDILIELTFDHAQIFVKGSEKQRMIGNLIGRVVYDLDWLLCPKAEDIYIPNPIRCMFMHVEGCALSKCVKYAAWYADKKLK